MYLTKSILAILLTINAVPARAILKGQVSDKPVYQIKVINNNKSLGLCSGTIISDFTILTAAHCLEGASLFGGDLKVKIAKKVYYIDNFHIPEKFYDYLEEYKYSSLDGPLNKELYAHRAKFDLALINLKVAISEEFIKSDIGLDQYYTGTRVAIAGYGYTRFSYKDKNFFNKALFLTERSANLRLNRNGTYYAFGTKMQDFLTAPGDSGGGLFFQNQQIGIVSGSYTLDNKSGTIFIPLYFHADFIRKNIKLEL